MEEMQERGGDVRCRDMRTPEELRDFISSRAHDAVTPPAEGDASGVGGWRLSTNTVVNRPSTGSVTAARGGGGGQGGRGGLTAGDGDKYHPPYKRSRKPLIILHGLPSTFVRILLDSEALGIDPEFIEAHAGRRGYRPMGRYRRLEGPQFACWTYPELVRGFKRTLLKKGPTTTGVAEEGKSGRGRVIGTVTDPSRAGRSEQRKCHQGGLGLRRPRCRVLPGIALEEWPRGRVVSGQACLGGAKSFPTRVIRPPQKSEEKGSWRRHQAVRAQEDDDKKRGQLGCVSCPGQGDTQL